jgi:HAD superfamily hydrolase (TIGR01549 family)
MKLKAVFFDFGGTIDHYPVVREHALKSMDLILSILTDAGLSIRTRYNTEEFYTLLNSRLHEYKLWKRKTFIEIPELQFWKEYILRDEPDRDLLDASSAIELTFLIETGRFERFVRPEMKDVMDELMTTGLYFGIISNVLSSTQVPRNLLDYDLKEYYSQVVMSASYGKVKPDPSIFLHAADEAGFHPGECIYVGNSPSKDIFGAKNAGYKAAIQIEYVDDSDDTTDPGPEPDFYIRSMRELPPIIRSYQN